MSAFKLKAEGQNVSGLGAGQHFSDAVFGLKKDFLHFGSDVCVGGIGSELLRTAFSSSETSLYPAMGAVQN